MDETSMQADPRGKKYAFEMGAAETFPFPWAPGKEPKANPRV
ncbi:MAG TPA: hypothetical protein VK206_10830 [Anaerolineales bacterium]|nr:hypothetical protein [Anaerolineales bacterium]